MSYQITSVFLDKSFEAFSCIQEPKAETNELSKLSKINVFVGPNNSGKSRLLRRIASTKQLSFAPPEELMKASKLWQAFKGEVLTRTENWGVKDFANGVIGRLRKMDTDLWMTEAKPFMKPQMDYLHEIATRTDTSGVVGGMTMTPDKMRTLNGVAQNTENNIRPLRETMPQTPKFKKLYFPILRGLRPFAGTKDCYHDRTLSDYFGNPDNEHEPPDQFTGLQLYQELQALLLGNLQERKVVEEFQRFLSERFFENRPIALIPKLKQDVIDIKIGTEREFPVYGLGDGIQSLIILTFPLFKSRATDTLVFMEEPEMFMHPGMQRVFLNTLTTFENHQFFLTTHSNHFLDITIDLPSVSVYTVTKHLSAPDREEQDATFTIENVSNDDSRSLEMLGVRNSSVFLSNCTIWVEGITDRRYFQHFLRLYQQQNGIYRFREDWHYSFVEYGGANITHWSVLDTEQDAINVKRLCGRLFLIADGDMATEWKEQRHEQLEKNLGQNYCRLQVKEVENLLSPSVLERVLRAYEETEIQPANQEDYSNVELGEFIEAIMLKGKRKRKASYKKGSTLNDKVGFCAKALSELDSFESLSPEAKDITKRIYDFIAKNNQ